MSNFNYINCICCGKKINLLYDFLEEEILNRPDWNPNSQMWDGGSVQEISAGYGSSLDGDLFYLGICDECTKDGYKNGRLRYVGDYIHHICKFSEEELKKQDEMRNREKNLNDLIP